MGPRKGGNRDSLCLLTLLLCISYSVFVAADFFLTQVSQLNSFSHFKGMTLFFHSIVSILSQGRTLIGPSRFNFSLCRTVSHCHEAHCARERVCVNLIPCGD